MKKLILLPFLFASLFCNAQNPNIKRTRHWYFGNKAGIDFSTGAAVADTNGQLNTSEGCASISDTSGNLLFYTDGRTVWNNLHLVMPNGIGLMGGANGSSSQQALIIPKPLSPNLYYLFTTDEEENNGANGMRYTIIDMNLDGGLGDVDISQKNILLFAPCTEKLAAVNHCNDSSVWVMGHEVNNNNFRGYLVTSIGINTNAIVSAAGHNNPSNIQGGMQGIVRFSPNGNLLCAVSDSSAKKVELFQFDNFTGIVSNSFLLVYDYPNIHSISFSPDNSKLYVGQQGNNKLMKQFEVSVYDSTAIISSEIIISPSLNRGFRHIVCGADGKLYCLEAALILSDSVLAGIENPNISGTGCNLNLDEAYIGTWNWGFGLPNFNESYFNLSSSNGCSTGISELENNIIKIFPNSARDWITLEGRGIKSVEITNVLGSTIGSYPTTASALRNILNISSLSCGIYFFKINMIDERFSLQKIIVQH